MESIFFWAFLYLTSRDVLLSHEAKREAMVHCFLFKMSSNLSFIIGWLGPLRDIWSRNYPQYGGACWFDTYDDDIFCKVDKVPTFVNESPYRQALEFFSLPNVRCPIHIIYGLNNSYIIMSFVLSAINIRNSLQNQRNSRCFTLNLASFLISLGSDSAAY